MKTTFKNSKGEFAKENSNFHVELKTTHYKAVIKRNGQVDPCDGNEIKVKMEIKCIEKPLNFKEVIFGRRYFESGRSKGDEFKKEFYATTWREAFKKAVDYFRAETDKYYSLEKEREDALINAEF